MKPTAPEVSELARAIIELIPNRIEKKLRVCSSFFMFFRIISSLKAFAFSTEINNHLATDCLACVVASGCKQVRMQRTVEYF